MRTSFGVPQGSILGPFLFVVYVNNLPSVVRDAEICLHADDTTVLVKASDTETLADLSGRTINGVERWFTANKLKINA